MAVASDRATFVIFITDGNPTFRMTRGEYTDSQLGTIATRGADGQPTTDLSDYHARYNVFGPGSGDWKENADAVQNGDHINQTGSEGEGRNYSVALAQAQSIVNHNKHLFTLGIGPAVGRLEALTTAAGAGGNYYPVTSVDDLNGAMNKIIAQIKGELGYSNVCITDGITPLTQTVQKAGLGDDLPAGDDFVYEKWRAATAEDVTAGTAKTVGEEKWFSWNPESEGAKKAVYNSETGAVEWNLGEKFFLEDGVKYRCSFKVWPSQKAYDTVAKLNNGTLEYASLDPAVQAQITGNNDNGYTLLTNVPNDPDKQKAIGRNVGAEYTYQEATKVEKTVNTIENTEVSGKFSPVDNLKLEKQQITIKKEWKNNLDSRKQTKSITLNVEMADASSEENPFATVVVGPNKDPKKDWINSVYISTGLLKVVGNKTIVYEHGHDFKLTEGADLAYHWELEADTYRPMVITDKTKGYTVPTAVLLKKVSSDAASVDYDYEIDGGKYEIVSDGEDVLKAVNKRRSNLNLTKKVVDKDGQTDISNSVKDETFEFTVTVTDKNGDDVWFSIFESTDLNAQLVNEKELTVIHAIPEAAEDGSEELTGYYSIPSGTPFVVHMKPGWNLRILNLPTGSAYTIVETKKEGYEFQNATIDNSGKITVDNTTATATGTINSSNTQFTVTALNKLTANSILIKKTDLEGDKPLDGATFKLYKKNKNGVYELVRNTFTVGTDGYYCKGLTAGDYKLEEQTPPPGYIITVKEVIFSVSDGDTNIITLAKGTTMADVSGDNQDELSVRNEPGVALPNTGGYGTSCFYFFGSVLIVLAIICMLLKSQINRQ